MDKIKKYIRCADKIITTYWRFIVLFLSITFICYYILLNRYEFIVLDGQAPREIIMYDRITGDDCLYSYSRSFSYESMCRDRQFPRVIGQP